MPSSSALSWIETAPRTPYFVTDTGAAWTPVGQNDALTWMELAGLFCRRDVASAVRYVSMLAAHGVTVMRLMLEYCHGESRYFERPVGRFQFNIVRFWDDLFVLCEERGVRILLTPFDTFWMWKRWGKHPYNRANGGTCARRSQMLICPATRAAIKRRLAFATGRWGASGALFAWDLWNEIHSAYADDCAAHFTDFIADIGGFLRDTELRLYGRAHPQTVSLFGPHIESDSCIAEAIFRHPTLGFASTHFYEKGTIDNPRNTVDAAVSTGRLTREALIEIADDRPFFDSEHGPIHTFKDRRRILPEAFDDEYFRHIQWAHFASGGAGGGMRWPNRHPHTLTAGMRRAQHALAKFLPLIDWTRFRRRNLNAELVTGASHLAHFGCADAEQSVVWLLRTDCIGRDGMVRCDAEAAQTSLRIPSLCAGRYRVTWWDTRAGAVRDESEITHQFEGEMLIVSPPFDADLALAIRRIGDITG